MEEEEKGSFAECSSRGIKGSQGSRYDIGFSGGCARCVHHAWFSTIEWIGKFHHSTSSTTCYILENNGLSEISKMDSYIISTSSLRREIFNLTMN